MRYRVVATLQWDLETDLSVEDAEKSIIQNLDTSKIEAKNVLKSLRMEKLKEKVDKVRLGEVRLDEVMPFVAKESARKNYEFNGVNYPVKMNSPRYFTFKQNMNCVACGLEGTRIFLEYHESDKSPHFNLYGEEDGELILMTKDHIHAKSCGGKDVHSNYQTMCLTCNNLKGHTNLTLDGIKKMREIYNKNKNEISKKSLHVLLEKARTELARPWPKPKVKKHIYDAVMAMHDLNLYKNDVEMRAFFVYEEPDASYQHIGCIKKGTYIEPLAVFKENFLCQVYDDSFFINRNLLKIK